MPPPYVAFTVVFFLSFPTGDANTPASGYLENRVFDQGPLSR